MLRKAVSLSVLVMATVGVAVALAQPPRGGQFGRGRGRGFGPPGGSLTGLLRVAEVRKELGITEEQQVLLNDLQEDLRQQMRQAFSGFDFRRFREMSDEERRKLFDEARKKGEAIAKKAEELLEMILEPKQMDRLRQLRLQREGPRALGRPEVAEKLGLSQEQRAKIQQLQEQARPDMSQFGRLRGMSREEREKFFAGLRQRQEKLAADLLAVLTPEQKRKWEQMLGKKFDFPRPRRQFRPRREGGRRRPGRSAQ